MTEIKVVPVAADWLEGLMSRYEKAIEREAALLAELAELRNSELLTREMIADELGITPRNVDYYYSKGLLPNRIGKLICLCTRGELQRFIASGAVNFHRK